jgi:hypothetical protein
MSNKLKEGRAVGSPTLSELYLFQDLTFDDPRIAASRAERHPTE